MPAKGLPLGASKIGGAPLWPINEPWPVGEHKGKVEPYILLVQLRRDDYPEVQFPEDSGILQILWLARFPSHRRGHLLPEPQVIWRRNISEKECLGRVPQPEGSDPGLLPWECRLNPERVIEYPQAPETLELFTAVLSSEALCAEAADFSAYEGAGQVYYDNELSAAPGTKIAGWPWWVQSPAWPDCVRCGRRMDHLLTLASMEYHEGMNVRWAVPYENAEVPPDSDLAFSASTCWNGLELHDCGNAYFFDCTTCPDRPVMMVEQSA